MGNETNIEVLRALDLARGAQLAMGADTDAHYARRCMSLVTHHYDTLRAALSTPPSASMSVTDAELPAPRFWVDSIKADKIRPENLAYLGSASVELSTYRTIKNDEPLYTAEQMREYAALQASHSGNGEWTESRLRDEAKARGWYVREGASVPLPNGDFRYAFSVTAESRDLCELLNASAPQSAQAPGGEAVARDREADRRRFSDPAFNRWLDEGISDAGHTVWDAIPDVCCAWQGWDNRQHYPAALPADGVRGGLAKKWRAACPDGARTEDWHRGYMQAKREDADELEAVSPAGVDWRNEYLIARANNDILVDQVRRLEAALPAGTQGEKPAEATAAPVGVEGLRQGNWAHPDGGRIVGWVIEPSDAERMKADAFCLPREVAEALEMLRAASTPAAEATAAPGGEVERTQYVRDQLAELFASDRLTSHQARIVAAARDLLATPPAGAPAEGDAVRALREIEARSRTFISKDGIAITKIARAALAASSVGGSQAQGEKS